MLLMVSWIYVMELSGVFGLASTADMEGCKVTGLRDFSRSNYKPW